MNRFQLAEESVEPLRFFRVFYNVGTRIELLDEKLLSAETATESSSARSQQRAQQQLQPPKK